MQSIEVLSDFLQYDVESYGYTEMSDQYYMVTKEGRFVSDSFDDLMKRAMASSGKEINFDFD